jgi:hypothetical protein
LAALLSACSDVLTAFPVQGMKRLRYEIEAMTATDPRAANSAAFRRARRVSAHSVLVSVMRAKDLAGLFRETFIRKRLLLITGCQRFRPMRKQRLLL